MMPKLLVLTDDPDQARSVLESMDIPKLYIIDEQMVWTSTGMTMDRDDPEYRPRMVQKISALTRAFSAKRPLATVLDMRFQEAIETVPHDASILIYDGSKARKLFYNVKYKTTFTIKGPQDAKSIDMVQKAIQNIA
jgi:hypothetical protein